MTQEEKEKFSEIKERLRVQLEYQLTNFRSSYSYVTIFGLNSLLDSVRKSETRTCLSKVLLCTNGFKT